MVILPVWIIIGIYDGWDGMGWDKMCIMFDGIRWDWT